MNENGFGIVKKTDSNLKRIDFKKEVSVWSGIIRPFYF